MTRRTVGLEFRTFMLALFAALAGVVAMPAGATDRTVYYVIDPDDDCIDYSTVTIAVATRDLPGSDFPFRLRGGSSCFGLHTWYGGYRFELVFAGGGRKSVVDAVWEGSDPAHGDRSRTFTDLGSCNAMFETNNGGQYYIDDCNANDYGCLKFCAVTLHDLE
jgi:hypothetical protein